MTSDGERIPRDEGGNALMVDTTIYPGLSELEAIIQKPQKNWYRYAVEGVKAIPELATNFAAMSPYLALAKILAKIAGVLATIRDAQRDSEEQIAKNGLYYLLKLKQTK